MSSITGLGGINPLQPTQQIAKQNPVESVSAPKVPAKDRLELSGMSHLMATLKTNDVRTDKISSIRDQIAAGTYDADGAKLEGAVDKMLDDLMK